MVRGRLTNDNAARPCFVDLTFPPTVLPFRVTVAVLIFWKKIVCFPQPLQFLSDDRSKYKGPRKDQPQGTFFKIGLYSGFSSQKRKVKVDVKKHKIRNSSQEEKTTVWSSPAGADKKKGETSEQVYTNLEKNRGREIGAGQVIFLKEGKGQCGCKKEIGKSKQMGKQNGKPPESMCRKY